MNFLASCWKWVWSEWVVQHCGSYASSSGTTQGHIGAINRKITIFEYFMYIVTKFCCNRSVAVRIQLVVDPQCKGLSLFIDLFWGYMGGDSAWLYGIRYGAINFMENFLSELWFYPGFFLMYEVFGFGEELCNIVHLRKVNMMWWVWLNSCLLL